MSEQSERQAILEFFNLDVGSVENVTFDNANGSAAVHILLRPDHPPCPDCGCTVIAPIMRTIRSVSKSSTFLLSQCRTF